MVTLHEEIRERVYAGVLGKLIGVYLGRAVEGWSYQAIRERFGGSPISSTTMSAPDLPDSRCQSCICSQREVGIDSARNTIERALLFGTDPTCGLHRAERLRESRFHNPQGLQASERVPITSSPNITAALEELHGPMVGHRHDLHRT